MPGPGTKVIIVGGAGQLGSDLAAAARAMGREVAALDRVQGDVTDAAGLRDAVASHRPGLVVNAAAFTNVERCEDEAAPAYAANAVGALNAARAAVAAGARFVHVSTDYVFPGDRPAPAGGRKTPATAWTEADAPRPLNVYGASKLAGEQAVLMADPKALVVRSSSLYGVAGARGKGGNFVETILARARAGEPLRVVDDQWMSPTSTHDLADAILRLADAGAAGFVHATNDGACTWHAFATAAVRAAGLDVPVEPIPHTVHASRVRRPANSSLHTGRLEGILGAPLRPWQEALHAYLAAKGHLP